MDTSEILKKNGFAFKRQLGQNFISDRNLLDAIVKDAGVDRDTVVLEIGAGAGALTRALSEAAARVVAYEIDKTLAPVLSETLSGCENVEVVFRDFLKEKMENVEMGCEKYLVCANLPYYVTTPVVLRFIEEAEKCTSLTVMVQEEVAARFSAKEDTPAYGAVTAAIARRGTCRITRRVPRTMFYPRPNVDSAVVHIELLGGFSVKSERAYRETVRIAFLSRRKTLENNLISALKLPRPRAKELLSSCGVREGARGETLSPPELGKLSDLLFENGFFGG